MTCNDKMEVLETEGDGELVEFSVEMTCDGCIKTIENLLKSVPGIQSFEVNLEKEQVLLESNLPSSELLNLLESTGKRAVLVGSGSSSVGKNLGAAVTMIDTGNPSVKGVIRFIQSDERSCVIEGTIDGLLPGQHSICVHELGDLTRGCNSCGDVYPGMKRSDNSIQADHSILKKFLHLVRSQPLKNLESNGEITTVEAGSNGRAVFRVEKDNFNVWDVIGRSTVIHQGNLDEIRSNSFENKRLGCGIIARSAGVFENSKKICACDGITIWDERNVPLAGGSRQAQKS